MNSQPSKIFLMSLVFQYLLKLSISLGVVYLFYHFFLRRLTFYNSNRWYLLVYSFLSFLIPLINIYPVLERNQLEGTGLVNYIPAFSSSITMKNPEMARAIPYEDARLAGQWILTILVSGIFLMIVRLLIQYASFLKVKKSSTLILSDPIRVFQVNDTIIPFSIGNSIFINQHLHKEEELKEIIRHEFIHVKQKHSVDIFLSELLCVLNWYNPFAWLIRRAIKVNLEFIADNEVLESGLDRREYQQLLLKVIGIPQFSITAQFNFSSLKKRIAMMNKKQSAKAQLLKLFLLVPVLIIVLLAFRSARKNTEWNIPLQSLDFQRDTVPAPPKPPKPLIPEQLVHGKDYDDFLKRNPSVKDVDLRDNQFVVVLKSGVKEIYDLSNESRFAAAEKKYGKLPLPPPPPPPARPVLPKDVKSISVTETKGVIEYSNGKKDEYDLTKPEELEAFQEKYQGMHSQSFENRRSEMAMMEMKARQDELMNQKYKQAQELEMFKKSYQDEIERENRERGEEMRRLSREKQNEMELLQRRFQLETERNEERRKMEFEKASKEKGADVEKLRKKFEFEREVEMSRREMELLKATNEHEIEMEQMRRKSELDARMHQEMREEELEKRQQEVLSLMKELEERNEKVNQELLVNPKNLSAERKKEVISQLEVQRKEINKAIEDLKSKEIQLNKQIQELKKKDH